MPDRRHVRHGRDRLLLQRGRDGLDGADPAAPKPAPTLLVLGRCSRSSPSSSRARPGRRSPAPARATRSWGQILSAAGRDVRQAPARSSSGSALCSSRSGFVISVAAGAPSRGFGFLGVDTTGEAAGGSCCLSSRRHDADAARARARPGGDRLRSRRARRGRRVGPLEAYRLALGSSARSPAVSPSQSRVWVALTATAILIPVAIWLAMRWALLAQVVELEDRSGVAALRRSAELVRGRWLRVGSLVGVGAGLALAAGPLARRAPIFVTDVPLAAAQPRRGDRVRARDAVRRARRRRMCTSTRGSGTSSSRSRTDVLARRDRADDVKRVTTRSP